ncbi:hypothetical protein [Dechloromonas sp. ZS-1]|uniref:hypothetical protein n=1 Tax=Dechloromonas sp. ZS-1 TaxID=3138067 RepID=UPI0031FBB114
MSHSEHAETLQASPHQLSSVTQPTTCQVVASAVFPTGLTSSHYPRSDKWTNRRWAWEFLSRNSSFRDFCDQVQAQQLSIKEIKEVSLTEFGLLKFKDYREPYSCCRPKFSSAQVSFWVDTSNGRFSDRKKKKVFLAPGEIILRVSLRDATQTKSRKALLRYIDSVLERQASVWAKNNGVQPTQRTQRGDLLSLLRLLDLVAYDEKQEKMSKRSRAELYAIAYPKIARIPPGQKLNSVQFGRAFDEQWKLAKQHLEPWRYLSLAATE